MGNATQILKIWNLQSLAAIYREQGDVKAAEEAERQLWAELQAMASGPNQ